MHYEFSYDDIPYPSYTFPQSGPDRLATIGRLFGMAPADPANCRVLELGCGDGANILSMAYVLPESKFVGVDLGSAHIRDASAAVAEINLRNAEFHQMDLLDLNPADFGKFDFVIAHGLFSWVPSRVREKILVIFSECLASNGIGYISYNANPGCHIRRIIWDLTRFHVRAETDPSKIVAKAAEILGFVSEAVPAGSIFKAVMEKEFRNFVERHPENILHDDFSGQNQPFYFSEFVQMLGTHNLTYLADANPTSLGDGNISAEASKHLDVIAADHVEREQYLDFIEFARFRSSLICPAAAETYSSPEPSALVEMYISSNIKAGSTSPLLDDTPESFIGAKGGSFSINHPLTKAFLITLENHWPRPVHFSDLLSESNKLLKISRSLISDQERTLNFLVKLFTAGFLKLSTVESGYVTTASERPHASEFARWQLRRGCRSVTTLSGLNIVPDPPFVRDLIQLLDGTNDRAAVTDKLLRQIKIPFSQRSDFMADFPRNLEKNLAELAALGLFVR